MIKGGGDQYSNILHAIKETTNRLITPDKNTENHYNKSTQTKGQTKVTLNDKVIRVPGIYNSKGRLQV